MSFDPSFPAARAAIACAVVCLLAACSGKTEESPAEGADAGADATDADADAGADAADAEPGDADAGDADAGDGAAPLVLVLDPAAPAACLDHLPTGAETCPDGTACWYRATGAGVPACAGGAELLVRCTDAATWRVLWPLSCGPGTPACDPTGDWEYHSENVIPPPYGCDPLDTAPVDVQLLRGPGGTLLWTGGAASFDETTCTLSSHVAYDWTNPSEYGHHEETLTLVFAGDALSGHLAKSNTGFCPDTSSADIVGARAADGP